MVEVVTLDGGVFDFGKKVGQVGVIVPQFIAQVIGEVDFDLIVRIMNQFNDGGLDFLYQDELVVFQHFQAILQECFVQAGQLLVGGFFLYQGFAKFHKRIM